MSSPSSGNPLDRRDPENDPYSYILPEQMLIEALERVKAGESPDVVVAELWIRFEWAEDDSDGDIVDEREQEPGES